MAVRTPGHRVHRISVTVQNLFGAAGRELPDADGVIPCPGSQALPVRAPRQGVDAAGVATEDTSRPGGIAVHLPEVDDLLVAPRRQPPAVGAPGDNIHPRAVLQPPELLSVLDF